jgi:hypothetical protein
MGVPTLGSFTNPKRKRGKHTDRSSKSLADARFDVALFASFAR